MKLSTRRIGASCLRQSTRRISRTDRLLTQRGGLTVAALFIVLLHGTAHAQTESVKIVGLGASTCAQYFQDVDAGTSTEREYFAWAQGFMSGVLMRAPPGKDVGLNLAPNAMPLQAQIQFLRSLCAVDQGRTYSDAVTELYKELRTRQGRRAHSGASKNVANVHSVGRATDPEVQLVPHS